MSFFSALVTMHSGAVRQWRLALVDVNAEPVDPVSCRLQDAVSGLAGDLEQDVDVPVLLEELVGERLAGRRVVERNREVIADVRDVHGGVSVTLCTPFSKPLA